MRGFIAQFLDITSAVFEAGMVLNWFIISGSGISRRRYIPLSYRHFYLPPYKF